MLQINGKTFMNLQEAVQWLLDNNALPFQSSANYVANTEIGMGTIINPSPAKVRIGSLIFFADSKVSTVIGLTENGFIVSDQYNDLVDDLVYVSNVALNASGHLIVTLSNGTNIDAGLIKQVSNFSINASQHLIANYNDGTSTDLGAIFAGNITIGGNLTVTGAITAPSIIQSMAGFSWDLFVQAGWTKNAVYAGVVQNGNKITFVVAVTLEKTDVSATQYPIIGTIYCPNDILNALYPFTGNLLDTKNISAIATPNTDEVAVEAYCQKQTTNLRFNLYENGSLEVGKEYYVRYEVTFLLSPSLAS